MFAHARVVELATLAKDGTPSLHPMGAVWLPDRGQLMLTTPVAFPHKAFNIRRDGRVALLYSDPTASGLPDGSPAILVQGTATAPDVVATPADIADFWAASFRRWPRLGRQVDRDRAWYYLRLPMYVTPQRIHRLARTEVGGALTPAPPDGDDAARIRDAVDRYRTAVFAARDETGHPFAMRAVVAHGDGGALTVRTAQDFPGEPGPAGLLWHRFAPDGGMLHLAVTGTAQGAGRDWTLHPRRLPATTGDVTAKTQQYLQRRGLSWPPIDWAALAKL